MKSENVANLPFWKSRKNNFNWYKNNVIFSTQVHHTVPWNLPLHAISFSDQAAISGSTHSLL